MAAADPHDPGPVPPSHDRTTPDACAVCRDIVPCPYCRRTARMALIRDRVRYESTPASMPHTWAAYLRDCLAEVDRLLDDARTTRAEALAEGAEVLQRNGFDRAAELLLAQALLDGIAPGSPALRPDLHARILDGLAQWQRGESPTVVLAEPSDPGGDTLLLVGARTDDPGPDAAADG